ncbi:COG2847 Copper(I)-binding protein [Acidimicrobiia bacterium]|jgi:copper(I)-binding protein
MTTDSPAAPPAPEQKADIYSRIVRFAPLYVVVFCIGIVVLVGIVRPFDSPAPSITLRTALVGADFNPTGAYMIIHNAGGSDTLLSASTPAAASVQLQQIAPVETTTSMVSNGVVGNVGGMLTDVDHLDIPGFGDLRLQPGLSQLLLKGLTAPLAVGQQVSITLNFEKAGAITVEATVATYDEIADRLLPPRLKLPGQ